MPVLSVLATLPKSHFFVIYYRCVTLADGIVGASIARPLVLLVSGYGRPMVAPTNRSGVYSYRKLCYNTPNESGVLL